MPADLDDANADTAEFDEDTEVMDMDHNNENGGDAGSTVSGTGNGVTMAKDVPRPRRKKARRACFACQRAHLTCGDERPCQRCIKRGLQDACHDGVRKKAKYLHDAPNEALMPGVGASMNNMGNIRNASLSTSASDTTPGHPNFFPNQSPSAIGFPVYPQNAQSQMPPPFQEGSINQSSFGQQSPISPTMTTSLQTSPMQAIVTSIPQPSSMPPVTGIYFDPSDPAIFNFDLASLNFGNHYGALEFGMLGHMAGGTAETPPSDTAGDSNQSGGGAPGFGHMNAGSSGYSSSPQSAATYMFPHDAPDNWQSPTGVQRQGSGVYNAHGGRIQNSNVPHAYAIGIGPSSLTSPSPSAPSPGAQGLLPAFDSPNLTSYYNSSGQQQPMSSRANQQPTSQKNTPKLQPQSILGKRPRDPSTIYESVKQPYSYTTGFHSLTAFLQRRFSPQKTLRIAKSLASIRPSFISCTKTLNREDLIFMERCFQRTLWEYEDFINACGTPTIVCRRTGEIAAVGKEFSILTGWKKDVLLGKEPNLNINTGASSGTSSRGSLNAPRFPTDKTQKDEDGNLRPQPVFLAELLDDESVIEFYEDFSKLAFGDSRGRVNTRCKLLRYTTAETAQYEAENAENKDQPQQQDENIASPLQRSRGTQSSMSKLGIIKTGAAGKAGIVGEAGFSGLGAKDGKVDCSYCWMVKRDVFDIPMLIVMNVSTSAVPLHRGTREEQIKTNALFHGGG